MKNVILFAACAALLAACGEQKKYDFAAVDPIPFDQTNVASMSVVSGSNGGRVYIYPSKQGTSKPLYLLSAEDRDGNGRWESIQVCGHIKRDDGKPSGCSSLNDDDRGGWYFKAGVQDRIHAIRPTKIQAATWAEMLDNARDRLIKRAGTPAA